MMNPEQFAEAFSRLTTFRPNPFHPLVWITGEPEIGAGVYIGGMSEINANHARVSIGENCDIASFVSINCADSHRKSLGMSDRIDRKDIVLEECVFVGSHCVIKGGAHIGHHTVVAAGTIVEGRRIPPYSLVIGNPMVVKEGYYQKKGLLGQASEPIPHNRPTLGAEEERGAVEVLRSGFVAQGKQVKALEDEFCAYLGLPEGHAVAVSSGTAALFLALHALGAENQTVAMPAYACAALPNACRFAGGRPLFLDNAPGSPNLDLEALSKSHAPIAIIPHMYGIPSDLKRLKGVRVVEDCAQSLGARVDGEATGLQGDIGVFSFYATKLMTTGGQGGMVVSRDRSTADRMRDFREFDQRRDHQPRFNLQMTDLQAAVGREQLRKLPSFLQRRAAIFQAYRDAKFDLLDAGDARLQAVRYRAVLRTQAPEEIISRLAENRIRAIVPLEEWELLGPPQEFPNAAAMCRGTVSLPVYPSLSDAQVANIIQHVRGK